jgi:hypothetical protein
MNWVASSERDIAKGTLETRPRDAADRHRAFHGLQDNTSQIGHHPSPNLISTA